MLAIIMGLCILLIAFLVVIVMLYNELQLSDEYIDHLHMNADTDDKFF